MQQLHSSSTTRALMLAGLSLLGARAGAQEPVPEKGISAPEPRLNERPARFGEMTLSLVLGDRHIQIPIRTLADDKRTLAPYPLFHFKNNAARNDCLWNLDGRDPQHPRIQFRVGTAVQPLLDLVGEEAKANAPMLQRLSLRPDDISVRPEQLRATKVYCLRGDEIVGKGSAEALVFADGVAGFELWMTFDKEIAAALIQAPRGHPELVFRPFPYSYLQGTARVEQRIEGLQDLTTAIESMLKNENGQVQRETILQADVNRIVEAVSAKIRNEIVTDSKELLPYVDVQGTVLTARLFSSRTISGVEAVEMSRQPAYQSMLSSWLVGLQQDSRLSDQEMRMEKAADQSARIYVDVEKIIDMVRANREIAPVWGFLASENLETMDGKEMERRITEQIVKRCERSTGSTVAREEGSRWFNVHQVKVHALLQNRNQIASSINTYITLITEECSGYRRAPDFTLETTELALEAAVRQPLAAFRARNEQNAAQKKAAEEAAARAAELATLRSAMLDQVRRLGIACAKLQPMPSPVQDLAVCREQLLTSGAALYLAMGRADRAIGEMAGTIAGYNQTKGEMIAWKREMDGEEAPMAESFWDRTYAEGTTGNWERVRSAHETARSEADGKAQWLESEFHTVVKKLTNDRPGAAKYQGLAQPAVAVTELLSQLAAAEKAIARSARLLRDNPQAQHLVKEFRESINTCRELVTSMRPELSAAESIVAALCERGGAYIDAQRQSSARWRSVCEYEGRIAGRSQAVGQVHHALHDDAGGRDDQEADQIRAAMLSAVEGGNPPQFDGVLAQVLGGIFNNGHANSVRSAQGSDRAATAGLRRDAGAADAIVASSMEVLSKNSLAPRLEALRGKTAKLQSQLAELEERLEEPLPPALK